MSKGKRKSDRGALELVRQRLRCQTVHFTEQDRAVLSLLCRTDIIQIIEVDLGLGPLRASQKNSVATMVGWLLARTQPLPVVTHQVEVDDGSGDSEGVIAGQDTDLSPSSGGGSCHTPSSDTEEEQQQQQQGQQQQQPPLLHTPMQLAVAPEMPAELDEHPWLTELHQQLEAAGNVRTLRADSTGTDETAGTEADSAWVPPQPGVAGSDEQQFGGLSNVGPSSDFGTSQLEEQLFNQLLLDMDVKPKHRASRGSSCRCQQQQQQPQGQLDFTQLLQDELLQQLHPLAPLQQHPQQQCTPVLLMQQQHGSNLDIQPLPAAAAATAAVDPSSFSGLPQVPQTATWPLPGPAGGIGGGAGSGAVNIPGALPDSGLLPVGLQLGGLSDASLPLPGSWRQGPRLSCEGGGGSFVRKRDKMRMDLPAVCDDVLAGPELVVEQSGPSADVPTKRMSITLPGSNDVASLPTSFSGKVGSSAALLRPAPHELQQLMQLSSYEDTNDMLWQQQDQQLPMQQQQQYTQQQLGYQQQQQGLQGDQPGASGFTGLAGKLKKLLRGKKSKVQRFNSVGAGGSFSAAAGPAATGRVASADAALAAQNPAWLPCTPGAPQLPAGAGSAGPWCADHRSVLVQDRPPAAAADRRLWHSMVQQPCEPHVSPAAVGGLSWHADRSTLLAGGNMAAAALKQQQPAAVGMGPAPTGGQQLPAGAAASNGQFAQQLAQLRAIYGSQQAELDTEYGASAADDRSTPAAAASVEVAAADEAGNAGLMGRLVRALRLGDDPSTSLPDAASGRQDEAHGHLGNADLLILGRCDGESDLAKAAQRWQTGATGDHQDVWTDIRGCQGAGSGC